MENEINRATPCQRTANLFSYVANIVFSSLTLITIVVYYLIALSYIKRNFRGKTLLPHWLEYILIGVTSIIALLCYFTQQVMFFIAERVNDQCFLCAENKAVCDAVHYTTVFLMVLLTNTLLSDILKGFQLSIALKQVTKACKEGKEHLIAQLKSINLKRFNDMKRYGTSLVISAIVVLVILIAYVLIAFIGTDIQLNAFIKWFFLSYQLLYALIIALIFSISITLNYCKKRLMNNSFYSNDITIQRMFNSNSAQLLFLSDFISYKTVIDCIGNIPVLLFLSLERLKLVNMLIVYVSLLLYLIYAGVVFLQVDKASKAKQSSVVKTMFCLRRLRINFGAKERESLFKQFNFDYSSNEIEALSEVNVKLKVDNTYEQLLFPNSTENNNPVLYFLLFKILFLFFQHNEPVYMGTQTQMEEEGNAFMTVSKPLSNGNDKGFKDKDNAAERLNKYNRLSRISRVSCISKVNDFPLTTVFKFDLSAMMNTIEEKEYKKQFRNEYRADIGNIPESTIEFKIESLFNTNLFPLYPFYQLAVKDILLSLDPSNNKELFNMFKDNVEKDAHYNEFYTSDSFLFLEVYEKSFLPFDKLKSFFNSYQDYLLEVIKNLNYTFLPLIIGVYSVSFLSFNKIVILYRHQLSFSPFVKFNNWIKFLITETMEETSVSQRYTDIIDVTEIEIKNNIKLSIEEYNEVARNILNDLNFIKQLPFKVFPKLNLFVGNQIHQAMALNESENDDSIRISKADFDEVLRDTICFGDDSLMEPKPETKEFGSEIGSLFEKEYEVKGNEGRFVIKIFFSMLFRGTCLLNSKEVNSKYKLESGYYCDHIGKKLLTYLEKRDALFSQEEEIKEIIIKGRKNIK